MYLLRYVKVAICYSINMELNKLINKIHKLIEAKEIKTISQPNMAKRIGVSSRTYIEYSRGTNKPLGMKALLNMLNELEDEEIVKVIRLWKETNNDKTNVFIKFKQKLAVLLHYYPEISKLHIMTCHEIILPRKFSL